MGIRRQSRELALQVLFQNEFSQPLNYKKSLENFQSSFAMPVEVWKYTEFILAGLVKEKDTIDALISSKSHNWKIERMPLVDLNILRIAIFEIQQNDPEVPPKVVINEALEISRKYGGTESAQFINGLLDQLLQD